MTPDLIVRLTQELLDCACSALEKTDCGCPGRAFVAAGTVDMTQCCSDGQLWVAIDRIYAYDRFPSPAGVVTCMPPLAADLSVAILRCAPTGNDQGDAPTCRELNDSSAQVYEDAYAVMTAVTCCLAEAGKMRPFVIGAQRPLSPSNGLCVGSTLAVTVALTDPPPGCEGCS